MSTSSSPKKTICTPTRSRSPWTQRTSSGTVVPRRSTRSTPLPGIWKGGTVGTGNVSGNDLSGSFVSQREPAFRRGLRWQLASLEGLTLLRDEGEPVEERVAVVGVEGVEEDPEIAAQ